MLSHPSVPPRVIPGLASAVDWAPTILDLVGVPHEAKDLPGVSWASEIRSGEGSGAADRLVFAETEWRFCDKVAVRSATHKWIDNTDSRLFRDKRIYEGKPSDLAAAQFVLEAIPDTERYVRSSQSFESAERSTPAADFPPELQQALDEWLRVYPARSPLRRDPQDVWSTREGKVLPRDAAPQEPIELDPEIQEQLERLGYLDQPGR